MPQLFSNMQKHLSILIKIKVVKYRGHITNYQLGWGSGSPNIDFSTSFPLAIFHRNFHFFIWNFVICLNLCHLLFKSFYLSLPLSPWPSGESSTVLSFSLTPQEADKFISVLAASPMCCDLSSGYPTSLFPFSCNMPVLHPEGRFLPIAQGEK